MKVLITGASGFTGRHVVRRMAEAGHRLSAFVRPGSARDPIARYVEEFATGTFDDPATLRRALDGQDALVNVASLGFGHARGVVEAVDDAGTARAVYFSTTSLFTTLPAASKGVRQEAEDTIQASRVPWTIFRPTMIYGDPGDRNLIRLIRWVDRWRVVPVLGPGVCLLQPVHADDLAGAVVSALGGGQTERKAYNLSGGTAISFNDLARLVGELLGRRARLVHMPVSVALAAVKLARVVPMAPRISREQVLRLNEHKAFPHDEAARDFGYAPRTLREGLAEEIRLYRDGRAPR